MAGLKHQFLASHFYHHTVLFPPSFATKTLHQIRLHFWGFHPSCKLNPDPKSGQKTKRNQPLRVLLSTEATNLWSPKNAVHHNVI